MLAPSPDAPLAALAARIDALLPQTQCTKCGYAGCRPYAEAIAAGAAAINRCPPGGDTGIARLAALLGQPALPLDPDCGTAGPLRVAHIDEQRCIGCTLCIQACPVDAIVGAARRMHTVLPQCCTGCDLCLPPCPVDCIAMVAVDPPRAWTDADAAAARQRHQARTARLAGADPNPVARAGGDAAAARPADTGATPIELKQAAVQAALERARARRAAPTPATHAAPLPTTPQR
jgi:electron transport complex protein RnfB